MAWTPHKHVTLSDGGVVRVPQVDILFCYFGIRKFATHWVSLGFFCMLVPLSTFTPEVRPCDCVLLCWHAILRVCNSMPRNGFAMLLHPQELLLVGLLLHHT